MIKGDINDRVIYQVSRMLEYEMENLPIDVYSKSELLVMFKYVLTHIDEYREQMPIEEEYEETCKTMIRKRGI